MKDALVSFARIAVPAHADVCLIHVREGDEVSLAAFEVADASLRERTAEMLGRHPPEKDPRNGIFRVLAGGPPELYRDIPDEVLVAASESPEHLAHTRTLGYRSAMVVPLIGTRDVLGAITFVAGASDRRYGDADLETAIDLGRVAGRALEGQRLLEAERRARERAERLQRFTSALSSTLEVTEVARTLVEAGMDALGAAAGFAWLLDDTGTALELAAHTFDSAGVETFRRFSIDAPIPLCDAMKTRRPILFENRADMVARYPVVNRALSPFGAWATLPFLNGDRALGGVSWSFAEATRFDDDQRRLLDTMVQQTALAIERCRLLAAERRARDLAHAAERKKDEFLAVLGHELRNPLAPLATAIDLMRIKDPTAFAKEREVAERAVAHLARLIDDLLDVSRITRGLLQLAKGPVDLADAVARAIEIASPLYDRRRHHLRVEVPPRTFYIAGDAVRLAQIFANLLTNAAKYTPEGGHVAIVAAREGNDAIVRVRDDGPGIAPDLLPHVFELFVQGARGLDRGGEGGLGIGLTLVKRLVELHGGRVSAETDQGTVITVRLPLGGAPSVTAAPSETTPGARRKVLVVDDNVDAAELLASALRTLGHEVAITFDGPSALDLAARAHPDVCVLDLGLPVMDGFEVAERLRAGGESLTLIAVTGYGQDSDRARTRAVGFDHHFVKPVDLDALALAISSSRPRP